jgi:hypothetical protein
LFFGGAVVVQFGNIVLTEFFCQPVFSVSSLYVSQEMFAKGGQISHVIQGIGVLIIR